MAKKVLEFTRLPKIRGGKNSSMSGKSRNFIWSQGKLKYFNAADLIPLKAGRNIRGYCIHPFNKLRRHFEYDVICGKIP